MIKNKKFNENLYEDVRKFYSNMYKLEEPVRSIEYVEEECKKLAEELKEYKGE